MGSLGLPLAKYLLRRCFAAAFVVGLFSTCQCRPRLISRGFVPGVPTNDVVQSEMVQPSNNISQSFTRTDLHGFSHFSTGPAFFLGWPAGSFKQKHGGAGALPLGQALPGFPLVASNEASAAGTAPALARRPRSTSCWCRPGGWLPSDPQIPGATRKAYLECAAEAKKLARKASCKEAA